MFDEENQFRENIFKKNSANDPFREDNVVYKNITTEPEQEENRGVFRLNIHQSHEGHPVERKTSSSPEKSSEDHVDGKRSLKEIFKDIGRQVMASIVILVVGFLLLNWSAYYQIFKSEWHKLTGTEEVSPLTELVETMPEAGETPEKLATSSDPEVLKKQIPELALEIAPSDDRIIIPRIDQNIPIVRVGSENLLKRDWAALEQEMQNALKGGVVHYPGTSLPGESGNVVITGHSSYFPWDPGRFKDVFALLHEVVEGDKIVIYYNQKKYIYEVEEINIVLPEDVDILKPTPEDKLTLVTCTPVGTNLKRLVVTAKPVKDTHGKIERET